ncbi:hypothetical protein [Pacificoceanicola onchidii]|uniref:hypothetical protein n=1 Tax=Pacificoceanicola onchidii TaxID=2562685 RepID=UPI0010A57F5F|nr:hypothetical protein [Pacificoceanicola onchidii]
MTQQQDILVLGDSEHAFANAMVDPTGTMAFLDRVGDEDLLKFMRRLPMVAWHQSDHPMTMADLIYEIKLWPYVKAAYKENEGSPGVGGRLAQLKDVYARASEMMEQETGEVRSEERLFNFATFLQIYSTEGLP